MSNERENAEAAVAAALDERFRHLAIPYFALEAIVEASFAAARLPERPDEGRGATCECCGKRALEPITDPEEGIDFCPRCAIDGAVAVASEARPADEGITEATGKAVEAACDSYMTSTGRVTEGAMERAVNAALAARPVVSEGNPGVPESVERSGRRRERGQTGPRR